MEKKKFRLNIQLILFIVILIFAGLVIYKYKTFGNKITQEDIDAIPTPENAEIQSYDYYIPNLVKDDGTFPEDDGETTILCLGNAPFSDDKGKDNNTCNIFAKNTGAKVYNCSIPGSYLAALNNPYEDSNPIDAFSFPYLVEYMTENNTEMVDKAYAKMGDVPDDIKDSIELLSEIDYEKIDVIYFMYDGSDYLDNSMIYHDQIPDEPRYIAGATQRGITMLREKYPWIRIIVMSPTYAFAIDENGNYVSSDIQKNEWNCSLSLYFMKQYETAYREQVSFVDNFYGAVHEDIAKDYLIDNLHLNDKGRELVAKKMQDALENLEY